MLVNLMTDRPYWNAWYWQKDNEHIKKADFEEVDIYKNPEKIIVKKEIFLQGIKPEDCYQKDDLEIYNLVRTIHPNLTLREICEKGLFKHGQLDYVGVSHMGIRDGFYSFGLHINNEYIKGSYANFIYPNNYQALTDDIYECRKIIGSDLEDFGRTKNYEKDEPLINSKILPEFIMLMGAK